MEEQLIREFANLVQKWSVAVAGKAKDAAFNELVEWLLKQPKFRQHLAAQGANLFYQKLLHRVFAAKGAQRAAHIVAGPHVKLLADRVVRVSAKKVAKAPKIPVPAINAAIIVGSVLLTGCDVANENEKMKGAAIEYEDYVSNYISKMAIAKSYHPWATIASPMTFNEWYSYWKSD